MLQSNVNAAYEEYCLDEQYSILDECPSCNGWGDHGFEEETGRMHYCYACCGTGKYYV